MVQTLSRLPARLQGSAQKEPPVSEGNQKKENSSAKFRWPGLLFFNYTQKIFSSYFVLLSCLTKALHEQHDVAISGKCLRRGTFQSLLTRLSAVSSKGSPRMHAGKSS